MSIWPWLLYTAKENRNDSETRKWCLSELSEGAQCISYNSTQYTLVGVTIIIVKVRVKNIPNTLTCFVLLLTVDVKLNGKTDCMQ